MQRGADFHEFAEAEFGRLVRALTLYCRDRRVAEELAQDALVRAHERWGRVSRLDQPDAWVHRVAFNLARSWWRRRFAEQRAYRRHGPEPRRSDDGDLGTAIAVRDAVAALPPRQREVVVLRYFLGHSAGETAEVLGVTANAVAAATFKAVASLRRVLDVAIELEQEVEHG